MELLSRYGLLGQEAREIKAFFGPMVELTRTLWEHMDTSASCNHGFASHAARWLVRDVLGVYAVDRENRTITLRLPPNELPWCAAELPVGEGYLRLRWERKADRMRVFAALPAGYRLVWHEESEAAELTGPRTLSVDR
jgi:alpha-L-rhamnosidase